MPKRKTRATTKRIAEGLRTHWRLHVGGKQEALSFAPGRVNLIGDHTDYNQGLVLPAAIDRGTSGAFRIARGSKSRLFSAQANAARPFGGDESRLDGWGKFGLACCKALRDHVGTYPPAIEGVVWSTIPKGSGLSSSAALELCLLSAWNTLGRYGLGNDQLAQIAWRAETMYVGVQCGIMDQMASALGKEDKALFIDTALLEATPVPIPSQLAIVVLDTDKRRSLANSEYNTRVAECRSAAAFLGVSSLRKASTAQLEEARERGMPDSEFRRARHVFTENARVLKFREALEEDDRKAMGRLCAESQASLRDDFEVSCAEIDGMVESATSSPGCVGARMTGAGFGGCCVALVALHELQAFKLAVAEAYRERTSKTAKIYHVTASDGAKSKQI
ncbi:MAG TPA: galactokinase [Fimbriimonadales bacterium]|nr:galactokinase [Fimbriimonadales bacterium]